MSGKSSGRIAPRYPGAIGILITLVGVSVLCGWWVGLPSLTRLAAGWPPMAPVTAAASTLCGLSVALMAASMGNPRSAIFRLRRIALACALLGALLGLLRILDYLFAWGLPLDNLGLQLLIGHHGMRQGHMSPAAAFAFALLGAATALAPEKRSGPASETLGLLALLTGWLGLARYVYGGVPLLPYTRMAMHAALVILLLATGVLMLRADIGIAAQLTSRGPGGAAARRLLPAALLVPLAAGALALSTERLGVIEVEQAFSLFALACVIVLAGLVWTSAARLDRTDAERRRVMVALEAGEERLRLIIETALDAVITMDRAGIITGWSARAEAIFGWRATEVIGRLLEETIVPPQDRAAHRHGLARYLTTGEGRLLNRRVEVTAIRRDESELPVELAITPIGSGDTLTFSAFVRDITERRRTEAALRESQQLLQAIIDNSTAVVYVKRLDGRYLLVNRRFEEIFQLRREAILDHTDHDLFSKEVADAFRSMDVRVAQAGHALTAEEIAPHVDGPHAYISVKAPLADAAGKPYAVFGISTDITDRKRAEEHLRRQLERLRLLDRITRAIGEREDVRSILQVVIRSLEEELPIDFGCVCFYEAAQQSLEVACVGVRSRALALELAMPEHARIGIDQNGLAHCIGGELVYEPDIAESAFPFPARLARGGLRSLVIAPLGVKNNIFGVLVAARREARAFASADCEFLRQLSEHLAIASHQAQLHSALQRAYEDLRQSQESVMQHERLRVLGQMASGIAHDINNALSPAALYAQSLLERDRTLSREARAYLTVIQRAIEDVSGTVARMREFYRPRERELTLSPVDLNALVEQVRELTRVRWSDMPQERGIVIDFELALAQDLPPLQGTEGEIRDALTNLVLNAIDAMADGGTLTVRTRAEADVRPALAERPRTRAIVEVADTGVGMSETIRVRCLEPFFTTKGERGTGLGLAMVYGMVQRHSGEIEIESEPSHGTTVRLAFPITAPLAAQPMRESQRATIPLRILIVDDDPLLLRSLQDTLQADGHEVAVADGGQAGIDAFRTARRHAKDFAVVITDLGMPRVDGRAVAAAVKAESPGTPLILLTGWGQRLQAERDLPSHVDRVLAKPPRLAELRAALAEIAETRPPSP